MDYSKIRGFNYQPSYGVNGFDIWYHFDPEIIEEDIRKGKDYFPGFNTARIWMSYDAYVIDHDAYMSKLETMLTILDKYDIKAIVMLFNRWHCDYQDFGGVYIEQLIGIDSPSMIPALVEFGERLVSEHKDDERIIAWDMCNEPFSYKLDEMGEFFFKYEFDWLKQLYAGMKKYKPKAPLSVSIYQYHDAEFYDRVSEISDIYMIHHYFIKEEIDEYKDFENHIKTYVDRAASEGKDIIVTEIGWGKYDDEERASLLCEELDAMKALNLGFVVHALCYCKIADLHDKNEGPLSPAGNLAFINKDGSLRPYHEVFNKYC